MDNITIVLHQPQNLFNVAAAVRAMANMGLRHLTVVDPAEFDPWRITGIAHRADALIQGTRHAQSLDEALTDIGYVVGTSARPRTAQRNYRRPREAATEILERARHGGAAIVFGREDRGLSNDALDRCHEIMVIPTAPGHSSLNLAQAVMLIGYELFLAEALAPPLPTGKRSLGPAKASELEEMYRAVEAGLDDIEFFRARRAKSVMRTLRTIFGRTALDGHEARLVASIGYRMQGWVRRARTVEKATSPEDEND